MRMRSVLALSALSAATFLAGVAYADASQGPGKQTVQNAQTVQKTQAAPAAVTTQPVVQPEQAAAAPAVPEEKVGHKHHHRKHHKHHRHHRHHRHHHHHNHFWVSEPPTNNFLLGGTLGYTSQKEKFITRFTQIPQLAGRYTAWNEHIVDEGISMGLLAGWQWRLNRVMLGVEGSVDFYNFERNRPFVFPDQLGVGARYTGSVVYDRGDVYGLTGRAGYFVTPFFMPYLRLGAQMSRDEGQYQVAGGIPPALVPDYSSTKKDIYGVVAGIGAEFPTYIGSSTIRFEYNFVRTQSLVIVDNTLPIIGNHKFRYPESHIGKVSWVWNFL